VKKGRERGAAERVGYRCDPTGELPSVLINRDKKKKKKKTNTKKKKKNEKTEKNRKTSVWLRASVELSTKSVATWEYEKKKKKPLTRPKAGDQRFEEGWAAGIKGLIEMLSKHQIRLLRA